MSTYIFAWPSAAPRNDYLDEVSPDEDKTDDLVRDPALLIPSQQSRSPSPSSCLTCPSPHANKSHPHPKKSLAGWEFCKMMCLAGG